MKKGAVIVGLAGLTLAVAALVAFWPEGEASMVGSDPETWVHEMHEDKIVYRPNGEVESVTKFHYNGQPFLRTTIHPAVGGEPQVRTTEMWLMDGRLMCTYTSVRGAVPYPVECLLPNGETLMAADLNEFKVAWHAAWDPRNYSR